MGLVLRGHWREAVEVIDTAFAHVSTQQAYARLEPAGAHPLDILYDWTRKYGAI